MNVTFLANLTDEFLACREMGHAWANRDRVQERNGFKRRLRVDACARCGTARFQMMDDEFHTLRRSYSYPTGYRKPIDAPHIRRSDAVKEGFGRVKVRVVRNLDNVEV